MRIFRKRNHLIHQVKELDKGENGILQTLFIYEEIHQKNLTPGELCAIQQLTSGRIASTLKNLEKKAFIKRMMAEDDRRKTIIKLTEKGDEAFKSHADFHDDMIKSIMKELPKDEEEILITALKKMVNFFEEKYNLKK